MSSTDSVPVVRALDWDSRFFGFPVGSVSLGEMADPAALERRLEHLAFPLTYVFVNHDAGLADDLRQVLTRAGGRSFGTRLVFRKLLPDRTRVPAKRVLEATKCTDAIRNLAYASGWCSRFARDERLASDFRRLYGIWIDREFAAGHVLVRPDVENPGGMVTVTFPVQAQSGERLGKIGLFAVDAKSQGRGIGSQLLDDVETWLAARKAEACEVVTQGDNVGARALYVKLGYEVVSELDVWHVWRENGVIG